MAISFKFKKDPEAGIPASTPTPLALVSPSPNMEYVQSPVDTNVQALVIKDHNTLTTSPKDAPATIQQATADDNECQSCVSGKCTTGSQCVAVSNPPQSTTPSGEQTALAALEELAGGRKQVLMLVHKTTGQTLQVLDFEPKTRRVYLKNSEGVKIQPIIGERENGIYNPFWR